MKQLKQTILCLAFGALSLLSTHAQNQGTLTKISRANSNSIENFFDSSLAPFYHGVASGDPLKDAVIIWTRVTTNQAAANVNWKVATNPNMSGVVSQGNTITNELRDYTVKVDVRNLSPNTTYYFQFEALGKKSTIGKTRTAPTGNVENVRFGIVSCSNYQSGYFNAYDELANRTDIDAIIHLGDYIYEYASGGYGYSDKLGRGHLPKGEIITLNDYRVRYSYYRLDPMLRKLHQQHPFILIWDDHEFANDANKYGAQNHSPSSEGSWKVRKNNAYKAYFEWQPVRANSIEEYRLYRDFSYGNLADLLMLDTRIVGRGESVAASQKFSGISEKELKAKVKTMIASRKLNTPKEIKETLAELMPYFIETSVLTISEKEYLLNTFTEVTYNYKTKGKRATSNKKDLEKLEALLNKSVRTQVLAKQEQERGATYKSILGKPQFDWLLNKLSSSEATWKILGNQVMMMRYAGVPTSDAWDGYSEERARIHDFVLNNNIDNLVVLTGDIHSTFAGDIIHNKKCVASEFVVPSVTSQNLDVVGSFAAGIAEFYTKTLNRHMKEVDLDVHGYYVLDVKEERVQADWYYMHGIKAPQAGQFYKKGFYVNRGTCGIKSTSRPAQKLATTIYGDAPEDVKNSLENLENFVLLGMYPNPMSNEGNLHYLLQTPSKVSVIIYDVKGQKVRDLLSKDNHDSGIYNLNFNVKSLAKGNYLVKIEANNQIVTKHLVIK
ncbi:alkaline phosphatase D family protein [Tenacibaculum sp. 190524A02b]|uniref:alkaline phosphatase D family protein n=1 Tax=Tenacibaculum vairaonense TaxID=3137860 RepID=UPI0031FAEEB8